MPLENLAILWTREIKQRKEHLPCEPSFTSAPVPSTQNVVPRHSGTDMGGVIPVFCPQSTPYFSTDFLSTVMNFSFTFNKWDYRVYKQETPYSCPSTKAPTGPMAF